MRHSALLFTWAVLASVSTSDGFNEQRYARCLQPKEPCGASGHMTMKGWALTGKSVDEVCSKPPPHCARPCGVFFHFFKLAAGLVMGQGTLGPLFPASNISWVETYSLAHEPTKTKLLQARLRRWPTATVLRHPMERLVGQFFATAETAEEYDNFHVWVAKHSKAPPRRGNDGATKLWIELDNAYVKVFSSFNGRRAATIAAQKLKERGEPPPSRAQMAALASQLANPRAALEAAKETLRTLYDFILIAEWLDAPMTVAMLGDLWCFAHREGSVAGTPAVPNLSRVRRARTFDRRQRLDHEQKRAEMRQGGNFTWWAKQHSALHDLKVRNALDIELYHWAAEHTRSQLLEHWRVNYDSSRAVLPALPCSTASAPCLGARPPYR
jgi:hypothetical protein